MQPFNLLDPLPAPGTTMLLEASAGTGKTYALAAMVTRYIAEGGVTLDQMLLITFTRAATRELRERVRGQLLAAAEAFEDPETATGDLLPALLDVDAQEFAARRKRLRDALADFDDASVTTTHGFCQIVLKSLGIAGDSESGVTLVDNLDDLADEITDDLYLAGFAQSADQPTLTRAEAGKLARHVIASPGVELQPVAPQPGSEAALRRAFAGRVLAELEIRKRRSGILSYDDLLSRLATALAEQVAERRAGERVLHLHPLLGRDIDDGRLQFFDHVGQAGRGAGWRGGLQAFILRDLGADIGTGRNGNGGAAQQQGAGNGISVTHSGRSSHDLRRGEGGTFKEVLTCAAFP